MNDKKSYEVKGFARNSNFVQTNEGVIPKSMYEYYKGEPNFEKLPEKKENLGLIILGIDTKLLYSFKEYSSIDIISEISILIDNYLDSKQSVEIILKHFGQERSVLIHSKDEKQKFIELLETFY